MKTIFFIILFSANLFAFQTGQQSILPDTTQIELRKFDAEQIDAIKADPEFDYERQSFSSISLVDIILAWLWNNFFKHILSPGTASFWEVLIYVFAFATIVYLVRQFMKNRLGQLFYKPEKNGGNISSLSEDNIYETDLNRLLDQAIKNQRFRNAVRLLYLISLKLLSDKNFILWKIGKTNHDYCGEIKSDLLKVKFSSLTQLYEYVWYGDFEITKSRFETITTSFQQFNLSCGQAE